MTHHTPTDAVSPAAERLNRSCTCRTLDTGRLRAELEAVCPHDGLVDEISHTRAHLFSPTVVFMARDQVERIAAIVTAVETVIASPAHGETALARAPAIARLDPGPHGVFLGYDFHLGEQGPQLIEINTNAGGALLNLLLARAQQACCREMEVQFEPSADLAHLEQAFVDMFVAEWRSQRGAAPLRRIAIVDDAPETQYLHPEFLLFQRMFERHGIAADILDPRALAWRAGALWHDGQQVEMIYNRLTDFYLDDPGHAAVRSALEAGALVLTPSPRTHALYANKRNLIFLSDPEALAAAGVPVPVRRTLEAGIPRTVAVTAERADTLWAQRNRFFFKPAAGYGSKAAYRGDKVTRRVWAGILAGDYIAQAVVQPSQRRLEIDGVATDLKLDIRVYVYDGAIQFVAARLYTGQTTNFRTPGGGFAPVLIGHGNTGTSTVTG